jgi:hypothetical protein
MKNDHVNIKVKYKRYSPVCHISYLVYMHQEVRYFNREERNVQSENN